MMKGGVMSKFLKIIFNQFFVWACKYNFANSPHLSAMYFLGFSLIFNILGIISLARLSLGYKYLNINQNKIIFIIGLSIITFIIYISYVKNKKYLGYFDEYNHKSKIIKQKENAVTIGYIIFSIILFLGIAFIVGLFERGKL